MAPLHPLLLNHGLLDQSILLKEEVIKGELDRP
jgi:hypothetical protein